MLLNDRVRAKLVPLNLSRFTIRAIFVIARGTERAHACVGARVCRACVCVYAEEEIVPADRWEKRESRRESDACLVSMRRRRTL